MSIQQKKVIFQDHYINSFDRSINSFNHSMSSFHQMISLHQVNVDNYTEGEDCFY